MGGGRKEENCCMVILKNKMCLSYGIEETRRDEYYNVMNKETFCLTATKQ